MIERLPHSHRYRVTDLGWRSALFFTRTYNRLLRPGLAAVLPGHAAQIVPLTRAFHNLDICFWFHNTDLMLSHTGGGARPRALADKMAGALLRFMRTGDPSGAGLPAWSRYTSANGETNVGTRALT